MSERTTLSPDPTEPAEPAADGTARNAPGAPGGAGAPRSGATLSAADRAEAMTDRNIHARKRGLSAPYIAGGRDPDPGPGLREERFYLRLLVAMVLAIVVGGLLLSIVAYILTGGAGLAG